MVRSLLLVVATLFAGCGGSAAVAPGSSPSAAGPAPDCAASDRAYQDVWSEDVRAELAAAFGRTRLAPATSHLAVVLQATDEAVAGWTAEHRQQCLARQAHGAETCAERRRRALGEVTRWLRQDAVEADWARAVMSAVRLGTWMACDPDPDPIRAAADAAIIAFAKHDADPLAEIASDGRYERPQIGYEMSMISFEVNPTLAACAAAVKFAAALDDPRRELQAWSFGIAAAAAGSPELKALAAGSRLETLLARVPPDDESRDALDLMQSAMLVMDGRVNEAIQSLHAMLARAPHSRRGHLYRAEAASALVRAYSYSPQPPPLDDALLSAVMLAEQSYGPMNPTTLIEVAKAGAYFDARGDEPRMYEMLFKVNDFQAMVLDEDPKRLDIIRKLADLARKRGDIAAIDGLFSTERARVRAPQMAIRLRRMYGEHLLTTARYEELLPVVTEALRIGLESTPTAPWMTQLHHDVGDAYRGLGRLAEAAASYERALAASPSPSSPWTAHLHRDLAMTLIGVPGKKAAALGHARQARKIFLERKDRSSAADIDGWLKKPVVRPLDPKAGHR